MISELAYIDTKAKLGKDITVKPFAYIEGDVVIGDGTIIDSGAKILNGARIGKKCHIHAGAVISGEPQDLKFDGEITICTIGDNTIVRECATINRGTKSKGVTEVGSDCLIMAYAHIAHDCKVGNRVILVNNVSVAGEVQIGDWAILGGHSAVHQFVKIGKHAMVAGGTLVTKDVPPYITVGHRPVQFVGLNVIGLRRRGFAVEQISELQEIYRILFQSNMNYTNACEKISEDMVNAIYKDEIIEFVSSSKRGIVKHYCASSGDLDM